MEDTKIEEGFKRCSKCGRVLPITQFNNCKSSKDGLQYYCKDCQKAMKAQYYQENKEAIAQKQAEYRANNKEAIAQKKAQYYQENKEAIAQKQAQYYQENKESIAQKQAQYYQENKEAIAQKQAEYRANNKKKKAAYNADYCDPQKNPIGYARMMVNNYRQMDRQHGFGDKDTISVDYFIQHIANQPCAHCGKVGYGIIGCNRLDNSKPHTIDNVEPCCPSCNFSQNILDQIRRGVHVSCKHKKQSFYDFVKEHLNEKSKK